MNSRMWNVLYCVSAKETHLSAKETLLSAKETHLSATETHVSAKETHACVNFFLWIVHFVGMCL